MFNEKTRRTKSTVPSKKKKFCNGKKKKKKL